MTKVIIFFTAFIGAIVFLVGAYIREYGAGAFQNRIGHKYGEGFPMDVYAYASHIRDWSPGFKTGFSVMVLMMTVLMDSPYVSMTVILAMAYITLVKGGISPVTYMEFMAIPLTFVLLTAVTIAVDFSAVPMGKYSLNLGMGYMFTSIERLRTGGFLMLKVFAAVSAMEMLTLSTPLGDIITVLKKVHVPKLIIELMYLIYRFIFIIADVHNGMKNAARARNGYCDFTTSCRTFGSIAANMLLVSFKKANAYYDAMEARCYDGELLFLNQEQRATKLQLTLSGVFIIMLALLKLLM